MNCNKTMSEQNIESEEKMITGNETIEKKNSKDIITLNSKGFAVQSLET